MSDPIEEFLTRIAAWGSVEPEIRGVALVGSRARSAASKDSDVDLIVIVTDVQRYLQHTEWVNNFGPVNRQHIEDYGNVTSLRVWYLSGIEVEYGFSDDKWVALPLDEGTQTVISDGIRVLYEQDEILSRLLL